MKNPVVNQPDSQKAWRFKTLLSVLAWFWFPALSLADSPAQVDRLTHQWLDIERQAGHLEADWKMQKPLLDQRLTLLRAEKKQLTALLERSDANKDEVDVRRAELVAEQTNLERQQARLTQALSLLQSEVESIAPLLPPTLAATWKEEQNALPEEAETSQRLQVALAQLGHLADFDQRISVHESTIDDVGEQALLVKQLYLGLGIAWFVSRDGSVAGWGQASSDGWVWHLDDNINADAIQNTISIFEKRQPAELVSLPAQLISTHNTVKSGTAK